MNCKASMQRWLAAVGAAAVLVGCGGGSDGGATAASVNTSTAVGPNCVFNSIAADCTSAPGLAPYVTFTTRSPGTADAAVNTDIMAVMSEPLEPASVTTLSLSLARDNGTIVAGTAEYDATRNALLFLPATDLVAGRYVATVDASVSDRDGQSMGRPFSWSFSVDAARRDTAEQKTIQQILDRAAYRFSIPGSIVAVRDDRGRTWTTTNGYADLSARIPMQADMRFRIGSNTKTMVASLILQLADAGRVRLDAPVNTYLASEMRDYIPNYDGNRITVRHLLNHTSGIHNFTVDPVWGDAFVSDANRQWHPLELLQVANSHARDVGAPVFGSFRYSNTNYVLLGLLIGKVSGMRYEDALLNGLLLPQSLRATYVPALGNKELLAPFSRGYYFDSTGAMFDVSTRDSSTVWSSGNVVSSIQDLVRWGELLGKASLLSPDMKTQQQQYVPMDEHLQYGLGVVRDTRANLLGHQGGMIGYTSQVYHLPDTGYTLAFFYNRTLALRDYSDVMTYDVIKSMWPSRPVGSVRTLQSVTVKLPSDKKPGYMTEY